MTETNIQTLRVKGLSKRQIIQEAKNKEGPKTDLIQKKLAAEGFDFEQLADRVGQIFPNGVKTTDEKMHASQILDAMSARASTRKTRGELKRIALKKK